MRSITFNGKSSLKDFKVTIAPYPDTVIGSAPPIINREKVAYRNGSYNFSRLDGKLHYDRRTLVNGFNLHGSNRSEVENKRSEIIKWLESTDGDLVDTDFKGYKFTDVSLESPGELEYVSINGTNALFQVTLTAAPYMQNEAGERRTLYSGFLPQNIAISADGTAVRLAEMKNSYREIREYQYTDNPSARVMLIRIPRGVFRLEDRDNLIVSAEPAWTARHGDVIWFDLDSETDCALTFSRDMDMGNNSDWKGFYCEEGTYGGSVNLPDLEHFKADGDVPVSLLLNGANADADKFRLLEGFNALELTGVQDEPFTLLYDSVEERL